MRSRRLVKPRRRKSRGSGFSVAFKLILHLEILSRFGVGHRTVVVIAFHAKRRTATCPAFHLGSFERTHHDKPDLLTFALPSLGCPLTVVDFNNLTLAVFLVAEKTGTRASYLQQARECFERQRLEVSFL